MYVSLAVDIGNSQTAIGFFGARSKEIIRCLRLPTDSEATPDLLASLMHPLLAGISVTRATVSSVVPALNETWHEFSARHLNAECLVLSAEKIPVSRILIARPHEVGVDRLVNTWMSHQRYKGPLVVVDMGTATTFDVVSDDGSYLGGAISPGVRLFPEALARRTARLPLVGIEPPKRAVGKSTLEALASGIVLGHAGMVSGLLDAIQAETGIRRAIATGGLMSSVRPMLDKRFLAFDENLTLDGIDMIGALSHAQGMTMQNTASRVTGKKPSRR